MTKTSNCRCCGIDETDDTRRSFLTKLAFGVAAVQLPLSGAAHAEAAAAQSEPQPGDRLTFQQASRRGPLLTPDDLEIAGKQIVAVPVDPATGVVRDGSRHNRIMLTRFDPADLDEQTRGRSAEGVVGYSSICTHDGCAVSSWDPALQHYMCPCHQSSFDPKAGGVLVAGPAYRPLPALPLTIEDGVLVVAAPFTARVGGGRAG